jgi:hypothetical protein
MEAAMSLITWLKICLIGLPLASALVIRLAGAKYPLAAGRLAVMILGLAGLGGLTLFFSSGYNECILAAGRQNCLFDGLATLSLFGLGLGLAVLSVVEHTTGRSSWGRVYVLRLLLTGAWAGMGLAENLLVLLISLNLFLYAIYLWLNQQGLKWRILVLRDDYKDEWRNHERGEQGK